MSGVKHLGIFFNIFRNCPTSILSVRNPTIFQSILEILIMAKSLKEAWVYVHVLEELDTKVALWQLVSCSPLRFFSATCFSCEAYGLPPRPFNISEFLSACLSPQTISEMPTFVEILYVSSRAAILQLCHCMESRALSGSHVPGLEHWIGAYRIP